MATNWTNQQLDAINGKDCSLIVSAAAGSGKTAVLVERLLRILSDENNKISADKIVVVTFSKYSASEMKMRLIKSITAKMEQEPNNDWLSKQHSMLQNAKISTIHSFCFDLIRDNVNQLNISNNFKIIEETEEKILYLKAIKEVIDEMYESNPKEMEFLSKSMCAKTDYKLESILIDLYSFLVSVPFFDDWLQTNCIDYYSKIDIQNDKALNNLFDIQMENLQESIELLNIDIELCEQAGYPNTIDGLSEDLIFIKKAVEILKSSERYNLNTLSILSNHTFAKMSWKDNPYKNKISTDRDKIKSYFKHTSNRNSKVSFEVLIDVIQNYEHDKIINMRISKIIKDLIMALQEKLSQIKSEENSLGFSDAEQLAIKLLATKDDNGNIIKTELAKNLSNYYEIIMIDEFQDSNNNQDLIFKMLSKDGTAEKMGSNMFVVGDVKQSIYNFRLANPQNFINVMNYSLPYKKDNPAKNSYINLNKNFRSSQDVIDFVNFIFENIMSESVGDITYNEDEKLIYGAEYLSDTPEKQQIDRQTEIPIIDTEKYFEGDYIARKIKSMLDSGYPVVTKDGSIRKCKPSDFCLLFMSTKDIDKYFEKFQDLNIPIDFQQKEEFLKSREVSLLINMVKIVDNPMDNMALVSIMMSPLFMFTPDDISLIRLVDRNSSMYSSMDEIAKDTSFKHYSKELVEKCIYMINTLSNLRNFSASCTTYELMAKIIELTDLISIMQVYDTSNKRRDNIQILLKKAQDHDRNSTTGISGFVRYVNTIYDNNEDMDALSTTSSIDSVVIQTIHKSKGLEYPFVFLCDIKRGFNEQDTSDIIQKSFSDGLAFKLKDDKFLEYSTLDKVRISIKKLYELRSEKMRLMYVALTRAKEKLFIPLSVSIEDDLKDFQNYINFVRYHNGVPSTLIKNTNHMKDWFMIVLCCCEKAQPLRDFFKVDTDFFLKCSANINMYIYNPDEETGLDETSQSIEEICNINESLKKSILDNCNFKYFNTKADLPARLSVSDIVKDDYANLTMIDTTKSILNFDGLKTPNFLSGETLTPAERGTANHIVMQYCDFNNLKSNVEKELKRLMTDGYITNKQLQILNRRTFEKFIHSDIFNLIVNNRTERERNFLVKVSDLDLDNDILNLYKDTDTMLQGCVDMLVFQNDGLTIIDYKSDAITDLQPLKDRYSLQLKLYKSAIEVIENMPVKKMLIYSMRLGKSIEI